MEPLEFLLASSLSPCTTFVDKHLNIVDGSFALYGQVLKAFEQGYHITFVCTNKQVSHHQIIFRKLGIISASAFALAVQNNGIRNGTFEFIDLTSDLLIGDSGKIDSSAIIDSFFKNERISQGNNSGSLLQSDCHNESVKHLIVLEDISTLVSVYDSICELVEFLRSLILKVREVNMKHPCTYLSIRTISECDFPIDENTSGMSLTMNEWLAQSSETEVIISNLPSGRSKDVHGRLMVRWRPSLATSSSRVVRNPNEGSIQSVLFKAVSAGVAKAVGNIQLGSLDDIERQLPLSAARAANDKESHSLVIADEGVEGDYD